MNTVLKLAALTLPLAIFTGCATPLHSSRSQRLPPAPEPQVTRRPDSPHRLPPSASHPTQEPWIDVTITTEERRIIRDHVRSYSDAGQYGKHGKAKHKSKRLPPGLAKKVSRGERLPPGWRSKLAVGQVIPVPVYRQCRPLPEEVTVRLPSPPRGTILVTIDGKVARILRATREVLDVFEVL